MVNFAGDTNRGGQRHFYKKFIGAKGIQLHTFYEMEDKGDLWWKGAPT
ncbi:hypothetical protein [Paenibacillus sp. HGF7]|nr:hypothetical protein [Paenibacillus sp. HGF7]